MKRKITKKEFELFKKECRKWIEVFGLKSWDVEYEHVKSNEFNAQCSFWCKERSATLQLTTETADTPRIKMWALHECLELLLSSLTGLAQEREWCQTEWSKEVHTVIRTLENILTKEG